MTQTAYAALRNGELVQQRHSTCRFLILPSFANAICWDAVKVPERADGTRTLLYRSTWRFDVDVEALRSPVERLKHSRPYSPTLEVASVGIDSDQLDSILERFREVQIPMRVSEFVMALDGTMFELSIGGHFCSAQIRWDSQLPQDWKPLAPAIEDLDRLFQSSWKRRR